MATRKRALSHASAMMYGADTETAPMYLTGLVTLQHENDEATGAVKPFDRARFLTILQQKLVDAYPAQYRSRVRPLKTKGSFTLQSVAPEDFSLSQHIVFVQLQDWWLEQNSNHGEQFDQEIALRKVVLQYQFAYLPRERPLWRCVVIEGHSRGVLLLWTVHHALADGAFVAQSCVLNLADNLDLERDIKPQLFERYRGDVQRHRRLAERRKPLVLDDAIGNKLIRSLIPSFIHNLMEWLMNLGRLFSSVMALWSMLILYFSTGQPRTIFKPGRSSTVKHCAWLWEDGEEWSLQEWKAVAHKFSATVNDLFLSVAAGGLDRYRRKVDPRDTKPCSIRLGMGVNIRYILAKENPEELLASGNRIGIIFGHLPLTQQLDKAKRIHLIRTSMKRMRSMYGWELFNYYFLLLARTLLPWESVLRLFHKGLDIVSISLSNVAVPTLRDQQGRTDLFINGRKVIDAMGFIPLGESIGIGSMLVTYGGRVSITLTVDDFVSKDAEAIMDEIRAEYLDIRAKVMGTTIEPR